MGKTALSVAAMAILAAAMGAPQALAQDNLRFFAPAGWEVANSRDGRSTSRLEFVPRGETIHNWRGMFSVVHSRRAKDQRTPRESLELLRELREKRCSGVTTWTVLHEDDRSLTYETAMSGRCDGNPPEFEVVRLIHGRSTWVRVAFVSRVEIDAGMRESWVGLLNRVELVR
jgi:hypothetical protein